LKPKPSKNWRIHFLSFLPPKNVFVFNLDSWHRYLSQYKILLHTWVHTLDIIYSSITDIHGTYMSTSMLSASTLMHQMQYISICVLKYKDKCSFVWNYLFLFYIFKS
jgi:hypothetical protein